MFLYTIKKHVLLFKNKLIYYTDGRYFDRQPFDRLRYIWI